METNVIKLFEQQISILGFGNIFICTSGQKETKTVTFPPSYDFDSNIGFKVVFVNGHDNGSTTYNLKLNNKFIKVNNNGTYQNLPVFQVGTGTNAKYWSIGAGVVLDLYFDSTQDAFITVGNPVVISLSEDKILADGTKLWDYTKGKISSDLGLTSTSYGGKAATAGSADKLTTARKTYVTLGTASTTTTRDWSGDTTIPVNGTLGVGNGGTGMTTSTYKNAVVVGNASTPANALRTVRTGNGAFYATATDGAPAFGTLPVGQGGTGQTNLDNVTVGNSKKLGNVAVQTTSIGGSATETGAHWSYVTKAKFTTTSGYIVYSNGLIIQWGNVYGRNGELKTVAFPVSFSATPMLVVTPHDPGTSSFGYLNVGYSVNNSNYQINIWCTTDWLAIGY